eukprot:sb/3477198/
MAIYHLDFGCRRPIDWKHTALRRENRFFIFGNKFCLLSSGKLLVQTENNKLPTHLQVHTLNLPLSAHLSRKSTSSILTRTTLLVQIFYFGERELNIFARASSSRNYTRGV